MCLYDARDALPNASRNVHLAELKEANMLRRTFLQSAAGTAIAPVLTGCVGVVKSLVPQTATATVNMLQLAQAIEVQLCPEWCWAACISMIFEFYGHPISQAAIVAQTYGAVICQAAQTTRTIAVDLSRTWIDNFGKPFTSHIIAAYDPANGQNTLQNSQIVNELSGDHPLLFCNTTHAEVLYSVTYENSALNPIIVEADVIDPWPSSPRAHQLSPIEMTPNLLGGYMNFLAAVRVV